MKDINKKAIIGTLLLCGATSMALAQSLSPQAALMARSASRAVDDSVVSAYISVDQSTIDYNALKSLGVQIRIDLGDIITAAVPVSALEDALNVSGVKYVQTSTAVTQMLDIAKPEAGVTDMHNGAGVDMPYRGKGVVMGFVDSGFDYGHAAFFGPDGGYRIKRVWEQTANQTKTSHAPEKFGYGVEFVDAEEILAAGGDIRNNSHGTHVASIAAGSDTYLDGLMQGMAPESEIVLVSLVESGQGNVNVSDAIAYIFDYADAVDKPCVINLSLGAHIGPHDGTSTFDVITDRLQGPGRLIVGAAGNHTDDPFHLSKNFSGVDDAPLKSFIEYKNKLSDKNIGGEIEVWGEKGMDFEITLFAYKLSSRDVVERVSVYPASESVSTVSLGRNVTGTFDVASEISPLNGKPHVYLVSNITSIRTGYAIGIEITPKSTGKVDVWSDYTEIILTTKDVEGFSSQTDESTISEIGGTANRILTVGAYTTRNEFVTINDNSTHTFEQTIGALSSFSNFGPTTDGRMKPQVAAPGCFISAAVSSFDNSGTTLYSQYHNGGDHDNYYGYMQGTSMASPFVAGTVAAWLQAWPEMTPEDLAEVVKLTARTDDHTGDLSAGSNYWGYGKINAIGGLLECLKRGSSGISSMQVDDSDLYFFDGESVTFTCDLSSVTMSLYNMQGALVDVHEMQQVKSSDHLNIKTPAVQGVYILNVTTPTASKSRKVQL